MVLVVKIMAVDCDEMTDETTSGTREMLHKSLFFASQRRDEGSC